MRTAFAIWLTGLPASGKSTVATALARALRTHGVEVEVLESDEVRRWLTPEPSYDERERELFYRTLAFLALRLVAHHVPVIIDATGNRRRYRDQARAWIPQFLEVFVDTPLEVCQARDPKGLYRRSAGGEVVSLPGAGAAYEVPLAPEVRLKLSEQAGEAAAAQVIGALVGRGWIEKV